MVTRIRCAVRVTDRIWSAGSRNLRFRCMGGDLGLWRQRQASGRIGRSLVRERSWETCPRGGRGCGRHWPPKSCGAISPNTSTTFSLAQDTTREALPAFLNDPDNGIFRGPYLRIRSPFRYEGENWRRHLECVPDSFTPYKHQAVAFARLCTRHGPAQPGGDGDTPMPANACSTSPSGSSASRSRPKPLWVRTGSIDAVAGSWSGLPNDSKTTRSSRSASWRNVMLASPTARFPATSAPSRHDASSASASVNGPCCSWRTTRARDTRDDVPRRTLPVPVPAHRHAGRSNGRPGGVGGRIRIHHPRGTRPTHPR